MKKYNEEDSVEILDEEETIDILNKFEKQSEKYEKKYDENKFMDKVNKYGKKIGITPIYLVFLLYHSLKSKEMPLRNKAPLFGAMGYFISFIDFIPDVTPFIGYCDDVAIIISALMVIANKITDNIREDAKISTRKIFPNITDEEFSIIDDMYRKGVNSADDINKSKTDTR
ncbi:MAG: DUF1232 domain-containing protein [Peptostreptococcaceae bacterium]